MKKNTVKESAITWFLKGYQINKGTDTEFGWIDYRVQRKIAKRTRDLTRYYTLEMLERNCVITKAIKGIDPDCRDEQAAIKSWMKQHRPKALLSNEERQRRRELFIARMQSAGAL
jgi:hypothetical protein